MVLALENFAKSGAEWVMLGSYMRGKLANQDIPLGSYSLIDLQIAPFKLDAPALVFDENSLFAGGHAEEHGQKHLLLYAGDYLRSIDFPGMHERARNMSLPPPEQLALAAQSFQRTPNRLGLL